MEKRIWVGVYDGDECMGVYSSRFIEANSLVRYVESLPVSVAPRMMCEIVGVLPLKKLFSGELGGFSILYQAALSDLGGS